MTVFAVVSAIGRFAIGWAILAALSGPLVLLVSRRHIAAVAFAFACVEIVMELPIFSSFQEFILRPAETVPLQFPAASVFPALA
jgi:hypothetical protein